MSEQGLDLLLEERERRQSFAGRRATNDEWTDRIIAHLVDTLELHPEQIERLPRWRPLRAKIRSIVSHMLCYETESQKLVNTLTESLPTSIQDPAGLLLSRASEHIRLHPHLSARAPRPKNGASTQLIDATIAGIAKSLTAPSVQSSSDSSRSWGDDA